ncbi:cuticle protein 19-like [Pollicipes pollicipes]|uniref:cuticle protein 19-like n=1 Tax=Pollicipes pollicipes TaxID=41117 RepID=UPI001884C68C|nr:cuticle protein 19-like [Pollicipes pollicipes]XP_037094546.1 cuticle protein 19-like [Pollicipes pollicipes]
MKPQDPPKYEFEYAVRDYDSEFGQQEARDGGNTAGSYLVRLPDSRLQRVLYRVDGDSGFQADVQFDGQAQHPARYDRPAASKRSYPVAAPGPQHGPTSRASSRVS